LREKSMRLTAEAVADARGALPTMTEARVIEVAGATTHRSEAKVAQALRDEVMEAHEEMMRSFLEAANAEDGNNA